MKESSTNVGSIYIHILTYNSFHTFVSSVTLTVYSSGLIFCDHILQNL